jgi:hypothetical protein
VGSWRAAVLPLVLAVGCDQGDAPRNEARAVLGVRNVVAAEAGMESYFGCYDKLECLVDPSDCLERYPLDRGFLDAESLEPIRDGYRFTFHPGVALPLDAVRAAGGSPSGVKAYAYVAVPLHPGESGREAFCADSRGRLCSTEDGSPPAVYRAQCVLEPPAPPPEGYLARLFARPESDEPGAFPRCRSARDAEPGSAAPTP